jgi:hypothetical protein
MPERTGLQSILTLGSGPIVIAQAAEFDYSGTQAVRALRERDTVCSSSTGNRGRESRLNRACIGCNPLLY